MKIKILQSIADFIIRQMDSLLSESPVDMKLIEFWYNIGLNLDNYAAKREIYLT